MATAPAGSLLLIRMMASSPVPGVVGHECDGEVQLFTRSDHYWCARQRQHEYPIGAHQPLHAADDKVGRTDVKNLQSQECRAGANVGEEQEIFEIDRDGGIGGPDELKYPSAVGRRTEYAGLLVENTGACECRQAQTTTRRNRAKHAVVGSYKNGRRSSGPRR